MATDWSVHAQECVEAAHRSAAWLLSRQKPNGGWRGLENPPVDAYYKVGWAFNLLGEATAAERALDYVRQHFLQSDGDFMPRVALWHREVHYQYANGWLTIGAQQMGRYDIAQPASRFLLSQQDPVHGGFYSLRTESGQKQRADTMSTGIGGLACLATGQIEAARRAAGFFENLIKAQPAPGERFYITVQPDGQLVSQFPEDEARWRVVDATQKDQVWYAAGLPFAFAVLLYQATGAKRYLDLAGWLFDFQSRCVNPWDGGSSGKAAWGCSMLYHLTGQARYRDIALHIAGNIMASQFSDGRIVWGGPASYGPEQAGQLAPKDFDHTAEFTVWLTLTGSNLLARG